MKTASDITRTWAGMAQLTALLCLMMLLCSTTPAQAADRAFAKRFSTNKSGDILVIGNTLMTCPGSCATVQNGTSATLNNNNYSMAYVNTEGGTFINASRADLSLPAGAEVEWAGLYWGGQSSAASRSQVRFVTPLSDGTLNASVLDTGTSNASRYQGFVDVTTLVRAAGSGTYITGNVQSTANASDVYAGWSLVVVYSLPSEPARNLTVFDGLSSVSSTAVNVAVGPFISPPSGPVNARIGVVSYEGDRSTTGDVLKFNGTRSSPSSSGTQATLSDACHPANNSFNSSICRFGVPTAGRSPSHVNQMGFDIGVFALNNTGNTVIRNGDDGARINLSTTGDAYLAGVLTTAIDVYLPNLSAGITKTMNDLNGGQLVAGDVIEYVLQFNNTGNDFADATSVIDPIPANTSYVPGTLQIHSGANIGSWSDAPGDDVCEYSSTPARVQCRIGTGATASVGGTLAPGASSGVKFRVQVNAATPNGTAINNTASVTYTARTLAQSYTVSTNLAAAATGPTDLSVVSSHSGDFRQGQQGAQYRLTVTNTGAATSSAFTVTNTLPAGISFVSGTGNGWTCTAIGQQVNCNHDNASPIGGGGSSTVVLSVNVASNAGSPLLNVATVSGGGDSNALNNSSTDTTTVLTASDMTVVSSHTGNFAQGQTGKTYQLVVTNGGGANSSGTVQVVDSLPTGLTATALAGPGWSCTLGTLTCTRTDALAAGASYPAITLTVSVASNALGPANNVVSVSGGGEANTTNNSHTDATQINTSAVDLTLTLGHSGEVSQGQGNVLFTLAVANAGLQATTGVVTVVSTWPSGMTLSGLSGSGWTCTVATRTCTRSDSLSAGGSFPLVTATVSLAASAASVLTPSATVSGGGEPGANSGNNTDTDATEIRASPDLAAAWSVPTPLSQGQTDASMRLTVSNVGTVQTGGQVSVALTLPTGVTATGLSGQGWACQVATLICTRSDALDNAAAWPDIVVTGQISNDAPASLVSTAMVTGGGQFNLANDTATVTHTVSPSPDLSVSITGSHTGLRGAINTLTLRVSNEGQAASANQTTAAITLPSNVSGTALSGAGWTCLLGTLRCTRSDALAAGQSWPDIQLTFTTSASAAAVVTLQGQVEGGGQRNLANDTANHAITLTDSADLQVLITGPASAAPGAAVRYTVQVNNLGPSQASALQLDLSAGGLSPVPAPTGACTAWPCTLASLAAGSSVTLDVDATLPADTPSAIVGWTATVSSATPDPDATNNTQLLNTSLVTAQSFSLHARIYKDLNHNGWQDPQEAGLGVPLFAKLVATGTHTALQVVAVPADTGVWSFPQVPVGEFFVVISDNDLNTDLRPVILEGWTLTQGTDWQLTALSMGNADLQAPTLGAFPGRPLRGRSFLDSGHGGGVAGNLVQDGTEPGVADLTMTLHDQQGAVLQTTRTNGQGNWVFWVMSTSNGLPLRVQAATPANLRLLGIRGASGSPVAGDALPVTPSLQGAVDTGEFVLVQRALLQGGGLLQAVPGSMAWFPARWTAGNRGTVTLTSSNDQGWSSSVWVDANCNNQPDPGETVASTLPVNAGGTLCLLHRVSAPIGLPANSQSVSVLSAQWVDAQASGGPSEPESQVRHTLSLLPAGASGRLSLTKRQSQAQLAPGDTLTYWLDLHNPGGSEISGLRVQDRAPSHTTLVSAHCEQPLPEGVNNCQVDTAAAPAGSVRWILSGSLRAGSTATVSFTVRLNP